MTDEDGDTGEMAKQTPVHDLGGRSGFGPVPVNDDAIFHSNWERRAFAVTQLAQIAACFNTDAFRHGIEREDPEIYLRASYFEKWIRNGERMLVEGGVIAPDAVPATIAGRRSSGAARRTTDATKPEARGTLRPVTEAPKFDVGDLVRAREGVGRSAGGPRHTRLPAYVAGRVGTIALLNDSWIFPDTHAHGEGENPTWVYAVSFAADDLWPEDDTSDGSHRVIVDLFENYLETP